MGNGLDKPSEVHGHKEMSESLLTPALTLAGRVASRGGGFI